MKSRVSNHRFIFGVAAVALLVVAPMASAGLSMPCTYAFSGPPPGGTGPWITAFFEDDGNAVRLKMDAFGLVDVEFVSQWYFNLADSLDPTKLSFARLEGTGPAAGDTAIGAAKDTYKADGDGYFDVLFDFPPPPGNFENKFTAGEYVVWEIKYDDGNVNLDPSMFWAMSVGGDKGGLYTAGHIQGIGGVEETSSWVTIPAPGAALLGLIGLGMFGTIRRRLT